MVDVTRMWCPESGAPEGADNSTHHLIPQGAAPNRVMVCRYCGRPARTLTIEAKEA